MTEQPNSQGMTPEIARQRAKEILQRFSAGRLKPDNPFYAKRVSTEETTAAILALAVEIAEGVIGEREPVNISGDAIQVTKAFEADTRNRLREQQHQALAAYKEER